LSKNIIQIIKKFQLRRQLKKMNILCYVRGKNMRNSNETGLISTNSRSLNTWLICIFQLRQRA